MLPSCRVLPVIVAVLMLAYLAAPVAAIGAEQAAGKQARETSQADQASHAKQARNGKQGRDAEPAGHAKQVGDVRQAGRTKQAGDAKQAGHANQAGDAEPAGHTKQAGDAKQTAYANQAGGAKHAGHASLANHADLASQANEANNGNDVDALAGIVVSRTITVGGQEFGQGFLAAWRDMPGSDRHTLTIVERPSARWGSEVWIEYAQRRIFHARLPNARAVLRRAGEQAAEATFQAILQAERQRKLVHDADLAPDEF